MKRTMKFTLGNWDPLVNWPDPFTTTTGTTTWLNQRSFSYFANPDENGITLSVEVAGIRKADIEMFVGDGYIFIKFQKNDDRVWHQGSEELVYQIGAKVDQSAITAELEDGILTIRMPYKGEKAKKKIQIK